MLLAACAGSGASSSGTTTPTGAGGSATASPADPGSNPSDNAAPETSAAGCSTSPPVPQPSIPLSATNPEVSSFLADLDGDQLPVDQLVVVDDNGTYAAYVDFGGTFSTLWTFPSSLSDWDPSVPQTNDGTTSRASVATMGPTAFGPTMIHISWIDGTAGVLASAGDAYLGLDGCDLTLLFERQLGPGDPWKPLLECNAQIVGLAELTFNTSGATATVDGGSLLPFDFDAATQTFTPGAPVIETAGASPCHGTP